MSFSYPVGYWTIHDLLVLFHFFSIVGPWPQGDTPAFYASVHRLRLRGVIDEGNQVTEKGKRLIFKLRDVREDA